MPYLDQAAKLMASSPYRILAREEGESNSVRFFQGAPAKIADLRAGLGVRRALIRGNRLFSFEKFRDTFAKGTGGQTFVITADTGEGKSTFFKQLALELESTHVVLLWHTVRKHDPGLLKDLRGRLNEDGLGLLVVAELDPKLTEVDLSEFASKTSSDPLPCPLLIAGTSAELAHCPIRGADWLHFAALDEVAAAELLAQMATVVRLTEDSAELDRQVPNLRQFVAKPDLGVFSKGPLIVSLLKATYGNDFRARLHQEYIRLDATGMGRLYRLVCFAHAVGLGLETRLLPKLLPRLDIAGSLAGLGGIAAFHLEEDSLTSRHPVIAKTLLLELHQLDGAPFAQFVGEFFAAADPQVKEDRDFIRSLLAGYERWSPVTKDTDDKVKPKSVFQKSKSFVSGWYDFTSGLSPNLFQDRDAKCIPVSQQSH